MKRLILLAALSAAIISCTNDNEDLSSTSNSLVPVELGAASRYSETGTRGGGTVGSTDPSDNKLNDERICVTMMTVSTEGTPWTYSLNGAGGNILFNNRNTYPVHVVDDDSYFGLRPQMGNENALYYPIKGASDFYAYHADDAVANNPTQRELTQTLTLPDGTRQAIAVKVVDFNIDGSQDLLAGKAENWNWEQGLPQAQRTGRQGFSAISAREHGIVPCIGLKHLLTRLTFDITSDADDFSSDPRVSTPGSYPMRIKSIGVRSLTSGTLICAYDHREPIDATQYLSWKGLDAEGAPMTASESVLYLKEYNPAATAILNKRPLRKLSTTPIPSDGTRHKVGDALFLHPGQTSYRMELTLEKPALRADGSIHYIEGKANITLKLPADKPFLAGCSYNVSLLIHGLSEIVTSVALEPWNDGGDIDVDSEQGSTTVGNEPGTTPTPAPAPFRYGYDRMDDMQKQIYDYIVSCLENYEDNAAIYNDAYHRTFLDFNSLTTRAGVSVSIQELMRYLDIITRDMPEIFHIMTVPRANGANKYYVRIMKTMTPEVYAKARADMEESIAFFLDGLNDSMSEFEKIKYIHDRYIEYSAYGDMTGAHGGDAYGGLVNRRAVCEGLSRSFQMLCQRAGINCMYVSGSQLTNGVDWGNHAFNFVQLEGKWYMVDISADGGFPGYTGYAGFLVGQDTFNADHSLLTAEGSDPNASYKPLPTLNKEDYPW